MLASSGRGQGSCSAQAPTGWLPVSNVKAAITHYRKQRAASQGPRNVRSPGKKQPHRNLGTMRAQLGLAQLPPDLIPNSPTAESEQGWRTTRFCGNQTPAQGDTSVTPM